MEHVCPTVRNHPPTPRGEWLCCNLHFPLRTLGATQPYEFQPARSGAWTTVGHMRVQYLNHCAICWLHHCFFFTLFHLCIFFICQRVRALSRDRWRKHLWSHSNTFCICTSCRYFGHTCKHAWCISQTTKAGIWIVLLAMWNSPSLTTSQWGSPWVFLWYS